MGELRERRRLATPVVAAVGGMVVPALIYLAFTAGDPGAKGWGIVMGTDTAFALGVLALVGRGCPARIRVFLLTLVIVDDIVALLVIALVYTDEVSVAVARRRDRSCSAWPSSCAAPGVRNGVAYFVVAVGIWIAMVESGVHPTIAGRRARSARDGVPARARGARARQRALAPVPGAAAPRRPPARTTTVLRQAVSPNERLQHLIDPWTSLLVVPVFALANAGIALDAEVLERAASSPITIGIVVGPRRREAGRDHERDLAREPPLARPVPADGRVAAAVRCGDGRRDRVHRRAADRRPVVHRRSRSRRRRSGSSAPRSSPSLLSVVVFTDHPAPARAGPAAPAGRAAAHRPGGPGRPRSGSRAGERGRAGDPRRVRRLRVPVLRAGRAGRARPRRHVRRGPALRVPAPAADRRARARGARGRSGRGGRRRQGSSGRCTTGCSPGATRCTDEDVVGYAAEIGLDPERVRRRPRRTAATRCGSRATSRARTRAASRARRRSSSTAAATRASSTSTRCPTAIDREIQTLRLPTARQLVSVRLAHLGAWTRTETRWV